MGLDINNYSASYRQLHRLRAWALRVEGNKKKLDCKDYGKMEDCGQCIYCLHDEVGDKKRASITKFPEFILHSDCDGGYISFKKFGVTKPSNVDWGNLDKLKKEVKLLDTFSGELKDWDLESWQAFRDDVLQEDEVLKFH